MTQGDSDDIDRRRQLYDRTRDDLFRRQLSNAENSDRAVLTLSAAFLALSITFISDVVHVETAAGIHILVASWVLFIAAIVLTVLSFAVSQEAINLQLKRAKEYYLDRIVDAGTMANGWASATIWLNRGSGVCFVLATVLTVSFVIGNLEEGKAMVVDGKNDAERFGAPVNRLDSVMTGEEKAAPVPALAPLDNPTTGGSSTNDSSTTDGSTGTQGESGSADGGAASSTDNGS